MPTPDGCQSGAAVVFLLQSEHPDGSTDFADTSLGRTEPHPISVTGDVHHETSQARFGSSAIEFTGSPGASLDIPNSEDFDFGSGPFTIDLWIYPHLTNYAFGFAGNEQWPGPGWGVGIHYGTLVLHVNGTYVQTPAVVQTYTWQHVAFVREGIGTGQTKCYLNGQLVGSGTTPNTGVSTLPLNIGRWGQGGPYAYFYDGLMEEVRIVKGAACWTGPFTPPGSPYEGGPSPTPAASLTPTATMTPTLSPTATPTLTPTESPTLTATASPTLTPTVTSTLSPTLTPTATPTFTLTATASPTLTPTLSATLTPAQSPTPTTEPSLTPTIVPTVTATAIPCAHTGDANGDGQVTPGDAQLTFFFYLACAEYAPTREQYCASDFCGDGVIEVCDSSVTPADAQGIMRLYLGYATPCAKRSSSAVAAAGEVRLEIHRGAKPERVSAEVLLSKAAAPVSAFGFQVRFDAQRMTFNAAMPGALDPGWEMFAARESAPGIVTVGAFSLDEVPAGSTGSLVLLEFTLNQKRELTDSLAMDIYELADGLAGCTVASNQLLAAAADIAPAIGGKAR